MIAKRWLRLGLLVMAVQAGFLTLPVMATDETAVSEVIDAVKDEGEPDAAICSYNEQILLAEGPFEQISVCEFLYLRGLSEATKELFLAEIAGLTEPPEYVRSKIRVASSQSSSAPPVTVNTGGTEQWRTLVSTYFQAGDVDRALGVIACESRGDPSAHNGSSGASGLFQHMPRYWSERSSAAGWSGASIFDPEANVAVAAWLAYSDGWGHWPNCG